MNPVATQMSASRLQSAGSSVAPTGKAEPAALSIRDLHAWYGDSHVLHGVELTVNPGETICLLGRNGAGRTTTLRAVMGLTSARTGSIGVFGKEVIGLPQHHVARLGVGYCPEERGIFASLTTQENFLLPPDLPTRFPGFSIDEIHQLFPNLKARANSPGTRLSGGEQQMLAVARIFRTGARLLLLDEISEGLAPVIVQALGRAIKELKKKGFSVLLAEQNFRFSAKLADRFYVMECGKIVLEIERSELGNKQAELNELLGV